MTLIVRPEARLSRFQAAPLRMPSLFAELTVLVVAAHPDDELLFAGAHIANCRMLHVLHTTDGADSRRSARKRGFPNRMAYAEARRVEARAAMSAGGIDVASMTGLGYRDQSLSFCMAEATLQVAREIERMRPDVVLTHAYEGGHPDHDATCFIAHQAAARVGMTETLWEFAGYHHRRGRIGAAVFATCGGGSEPYELSSDVRLWKRTMLDRYTSQSAAIAAFLTEVESIRSAPRYNFLRPPPGVDWPRGGALIASPSVVWSHIAAQAIADLQAIPILIRRRWTLRLAYRIARWTWKKRGLAYDWAKG